MWWVLAAQAAMGVLGGKANREITKLNNRTAQVQADASNRVRQAGLRATAAEGSLARFVQSVNNQRVLASGGAALEASVLNYQRHKDDAIRTSLSDQIAQSEQAGATAAMQAMSGTGGTAGDMVSAATALRDSMVRQQMQDREGMVDFDQRRRAESIMRQTVGGLDQSIIFDALDYRTDVAHKQAIGSVLGDALAGLGMKGTQEAIQIGGEYAQKGYDWFRTTGTRRGATFKMDTGNYGGGI